MNKWTAIAITVLFIAGLIPLLWLKPGFIISNGDNIPLFLNPHKTLTLATAMWSPDYLGFANPTPAYTLYTFTGSFLVSLGLSVDVVQILLQIFLYMGAGFSMYFFSKTIYPNHKVAPLFAAFFYLFNLEILESRFNLGFAWTYTFLPLLLALFVRAINAAYRGDKKSANVGVLFFALVSVPALSVASINPANIALFLFSLAVFAVYYLVKYRKCLSPLIFYVSKIIAVTIPVNIWWLYPMLNTFLFSPTALNSQVTVDAWSWTHARGSFLNLFWLNGTWGWLPEYIPYLDYYASSAVALLVFVPFAVAAMALLFKGSRARFNAYIMGCVLVFLFLAKGLHDPFGGLNSLLYENVSLMSMFREPASKFTLTIIPFLALLIGYTAESIANAKLSIKPKTLRIVKTTVLVVIAAGFVFASLPIVTGFVDSKTDELPFSSYVQIPQYWYDATEWINNQPGDWKILLTPLNDFYQLPYTWGYYGSDQMLEWFFEKPIVSTVALNGYVTSSNTSADLMQIRSSVKFNNTTEFKAMLDLLSIKYVVQRNDVQTDFTRSTTYGNEVDYEERDLVSASEMHDFFAAQPYLKIVKTFGELDIYEYTEAKPSLYALQPSTLLECNIQIDTQTVLDKNWDFTSQSAVDEWVNSNDVNQLPATCIITQKNSRLEADMYRTSSGWINVGSPLLPAKNQSRYSISANLSVANVSQVNVKIAEYSENHTLIRTSIIARIFGNVTSYDLTYSFEPKKLSVAYFKIEFRSYFDSAQTTRSYLYLSNVRVVGVVSALNTVGAENVYGDMLENEVAAVLNAEEVGAGKMVVTVNASEPFILASSQVLDRYWVANVNGQQISPTPTFLGLKGFMINHTGQLTITLEYQPQVWFNYSLAISIFTVLLLVVGLVFLNRETFITLIGKNN